MWWLSDRSHAAARFVRQYLRTHTATGNTADGGTLPHSRLAQIYAGRASARCFGVPVSDPRHPDVWGVVQVGVVYTGGKGKIAEHGGANPADRDVPILVYVPDAVHPGSYRSWVETTQIAPTIIQLLGSTPSSCRPSRRRGRQSCPASVADCDPGRRALRPPTRLLPRAEDELN